MALVAILNISLQFGTCRRVPWQRTDQTSTDQLFRIQPTQAERRARLTFGRSVRNLYNPNFTNSFRYQHRYTQQEEDSYATVFWGSSSWLGRQSSFSSCWSDQGLAITFLIQLRVMTQRQHVPTTEYPPTPHKFWFQQSIPTHHNPTGGAILALGEPSPGGAHFHLHRFLSLGVRPLFCSLNSSDRRHRQFSA